MQEYTFEMNDCKFVGYVAQDPEPYEIPTKSGYSIPALDIYISIPSRYRKVTVHCFAVKSQAEKLQALLQKSNKVFVDTTFCPTQTQNNTYRNRFMIKHLVVMEAKLTYNPESNTLDLAQYLK